MGDPLPDGAGTGAEESSLAETVPGAGGGYGLGWAPRVSGLL